MTLKDTKKDSKIVSKSDDKGSCKIETDSIKFGRLSIHKEGYLLIKEEISPTDLTFAQL